MKNLNKPKIFFLGKYLTYGRLIKETEPLFAEGHTKINYIIKNPTAILGKQSIQAINSKLFIDIPILQGGEIVDRAKIYLQDSYGNYFKDVVSLKLSDEIDRLRLENETLTAQNGNLSSNIKKLAADYERVDAQRRDYYKKWRTTAGGFGHEEGRG